VGQADVVKAYKLSSWARRTECMQIGVVEAAGRIDPILPITV